MIASLGAGDVREARRSAPCHAAEAELVRVRPLVRRRRAGSEESRADRHEHTLQGATAVERRERRREGHLSRSDRGGGRHGEARDRLHERRRVGDVGGVARPARARREDAVAAERGRQAALRRGSGVLALLTHTATWKTQLPFLPPTPSKSQRGSPSMQLTRWLGTCRRPGRELANGGTGWTSHSVKQSLLGGPVPGTQVPGAAARQLGGGMGSKVTLKESRPPIEA